MGIEDIGFDWPELLPAQRSKEGIAGIAFELIVYAALVYGGRRDNYDRGPFTLVC
jgi:hypothetical protein